MLEYMGNEGVGSEEIDKFMGWTTVDMGDERLRSAKPTSKEGRWKRGAAERGNVGAGMQAKARELRHKYTRERDQAKQSGGGGGSDSD